MGTSEKDYQRVEKRLSETLIVYVNKDENYKLDVGYDVKKLKKLCKDEDVYYDGFCKYMQEKLNDD